ncbi:hypothetical protein GWI33_016393 [Rhynchophorus ferrugineus]|uniref:Uncharacterized protein n=1 Tax=Rhynchophorus ferrugineus TaxID=354439 RepID=A0A834IBA1_RHYFE|nr:hypothetical protein GWI33_016393 [Rhynchophorus ferrugineus]
MGLFLVGDVDRRLDEKPPRFSGVLKFFCVRLGFLSKTKRPNKIRTIDLEPQKKNRPKENQRKKSNDKQHKSTDQDGISAVIPNGYRRSHLWEVFDIPGQFSVARNISKTPSSVPPDLEITANDQPAFWSARPATEKPLNGHWTPRLFFA